jgi:hypothetical protein
MRVRIIFDSTLLALMLDRWATALDLVADHLA